MPGLFLRPFPADYMLRPRFEIPRQDNAPQMPDRTPSPEPIQDRNRKATASASMPATTIMKRKVCEQNDAVWLILLRASSAVLFSLGLRAHSAGS